MKRILHTKMNFNASWAMAVGGMIGGGIFSVLGILTQAVGQWAWLSFIVAGLIALLSGYSYCQLSIKYQEGGGVVSFLRKMHHKNFSRGVSWILILGYILTISVYAFTFGHYVAHVFNWGGPFARFLAASVIVLFTLINLRGVSDLSNVEVFSVWGKLILLIGLAACGLWTWQPEGFTQGVTPHPWYSAFLGAAIIFMAYEGFQLLAYDYKDIDNPEKYLPLSIYTAIITVIIVYVLVTLGIQMLIGADTIIEKKEIALAVAGKAALGNSGLILMTMAAAFSTASAINATLFSSARLMEYAAENEQLPKMFSKNNKKGIPFYAVTMIAVLALILSVIGNLGALVEAASLIFLLVFSAVNLIAFLEKTARRWLSFVGFLLTLLSFFYALWYQFYHAPLITVSLVASMLVILSINFFRVQS